MKSSQGYLTCKKTHPPRTLPQAQSIPRVVRGVLVGWAFSYRRGTPVLLFGSHQASRYRGTLPFRNNAPLRTYSTTMPRALWNPGMGLFRVSEVPRCEGSQQKPAAGGNGNVYENAKHDSYSPGREIGRNLRALQGYLAHKKQPPRRTLHSHHVWGPMVALGKGGVSCERGTSVAARSHPEGHPCPDRWAEWLAHQNELQGCLAPKKTQPPRTLP